MLKTKFIFMLGIIVMYIFNAYSMPARVRKELETAIQRANRANIISGAAATNADTALQRATDALDRTIRAEEAIENIQVLHDQTAHNAQTAQQAEQACAANIEAACTQFRTDFENLVNRQRERDVQTEIAKINEMERLGIFDRQATIQANAAARATVDVANTNWNRFHQFFDDPKQVVKFVLIIAAIALVIYGAKHGVPILMNYLTRPQVVIETSKTGWFGWGEEEQAISLNDLIFNPILQKQLFDLALRVKSAKNYNENLPNILFYGAPGTGKTAFARALAYFSGLNYALTSGSEFAKITDLGIANDELRELLNWAKDDEKGLIVFVDEAESLFANRKLPTTAKSAQDFINTFLALIPDKSQKKLMFIFATNHPFKLDDAIIDRIGPKIEFVLPESPERKMILAMYLQKFASENKDAKVDIHSEVKENLAIYADALAGLSPRAIKFVAEEMIIKARRQDSKLLTPDMAQEVLDEAIHTMQQESQWKTERNELAASLKEV